MAEAESGRPRGDSIRPRAFATVGGFSAYDDPMSKVLDLDSQASGPIAWLGYYLGALALMLGLMNGVRLVTLILAMTDQGPPPVAPPQEIDVMREEAPPPPPAPTQAEPEAKPEPAPPRAKLHDAPPPPPAPAQAGKVLTQEPDPNEPVDLTGNTIVTGNADAYAGGTTASNGTSTTAVRGLATPGGVPGGTGKPQAAPVAGADRTRAASVGGGAEWSCPFPPEADTGQQIDEAYVSLQVDVRADGSAASVHVMTDPGNGFGREARRCAMSKRYQTALDRDGNPLPGTTKPFRVHFSR